jgi:hypothetical protein
MAADSCNQSLPTERRIAAQMLLSGPEILKLLAEREALLRVLDAARHWTGGYPSLIWHTGDNMLALAIGAYDALAAGEK